MLCLGGSFAQQCPCCQAPPLRCFGIHSTKKEHRPLSSPVLREGLFKFSSIPLPISLFTIRHMHICTSRPLCNLRAWSHYSCRLQSPSVAVHFAYCFKSHSNAQKPSVISAVESLQIHIHCPDTFGSFTCPRVWKVTWRFIRSDPEASIMPLWTVIFSCNCSSMFCDMEHTAYSCSQDF